MLQKKQWKEHDEEECVLVRVTVKNIFLLIFLPRTSKNIPGKQIYFQQNFTCQLAEGKKHIRWTGYFTHSSLLSIGIYVRSQMLKLFTSTCLWHKPEKISQFDMSTNILKESVALLMALK